MQPKAVRRFCGSSHVKSLTDETAAPLARRAADERCIDIACASRRQCTSGNRLLPIDRSRADLALQWLSVGRRNQDHLEPTVRLQSLQSHW